MATLITHPVIPPLPQGRWECKTKGRDEGWCVCDPDMLYRTDKEYRYIPPEIWKVRAWAHSLVDYIADACEAGLKCEFDENHAFVVFQRDGELVVGFALPEKKK